MPINLDGLTDEELLDLAKQAIGRFSGDPDEFESMADEIDEAIEQRRGEIYAPLHDDPPPTPGFTFSKIIPPCPA